MEKARVVWLQVFHQSQAERPYFRWGEKERTLSLLDKARPEEKTDNYKIQKG
jgi:hypothetical protein